MTDRRTIGPDREPPPPATVHNLARPPKMSPPLPAGDDLEALHGTSHKTRIARYRKAIRTLQRLIAEDLQLEARIRLAAKAPFPAGGVGGARHSGISDPTYKAAQWGHIKDPAERVFDAANEATKALWSARQYLGGVTRMIESETPEAKEKFAAAVKQLFDREEKALVDTGCTNCAKIGEYAKRGEPPAVPKDCTLCRWCRIFELEHGVEPPRSILRKHHQGQRISTRDIDIALKDTPHTVQTQKPGS